MADGHATALGGAASPRRRAACVAFQAPVSAFGPPPTSPQSGQPYAQRSTAAARAYGSAACPAVRKSHAVLPLHGAKHVIPEESRDHRGHARVSKLGAPHMDDLHPELAQAL